MTLPIYHAFLQERLFYHKMFQQTTVKKTLMQLVIHLNFVLPCFLKKSFLFYYPYGK